MKTVLLLVMAMSGSVFPASGCFAASLSGDPARGEKAHAVCLDCHGTGVYAARDRKVKSLSSLRKEVARWGDYYNPALSKQEVDDISAYLNSRFYKF